MAIVSVIVPVYKVEKYINKCVDSILNQSFDDFELILVDDGSPDNCPQICDEYAKRDKRIVVIHKDNGGLSSARNAGLDIAKGQYISFIDSDDYVSSTYLEKLYNKIISNKRLDIVACNFSEIDDGGMFLKNNSSFNDFEITKDLYFDQPYRDAIFVVAWNKIYSAEIFKELRYPLGKIHEDEYLIHRIIHLCDCIGYISEPLYYYRQRPNSIMGTENKKESILSSLDVYSDRSLFYLTINNIPISEFYYQKAFVKLFKNYIFLHKNYVYKCVFKRMKKIYKNRKIRKNKTENLFYFWPRLCLLLKGKTL